MVGIDPADLWLIAQQARNPFRVSQAALLSALVSAFIAAMLAGLPNDAKADQNGSQSSQVKGEPSIHRHAFGTRAVPTDRWVANL